MSSEKIKRLEKEVLEKGTVVEVLVEKVNKYKVDVQKLTKELEQISIKYETEKKENDRLALELSQLQESVSVQTVPVYMHELDIGSDSYRSEAGSRQSKLPLLTPGISSDEIAYRKCQKQVEDLKSENERLKEQLSDSQLNAINEWYTNALNRLQVDVEKSNFDSDFNIKGDHEETYAAKYKIKAIRECMKKKIKDMERLEKYHSALQEVMEDMKNRLYALSQSKQPSNSAGKKGKRGKKNDERTTPDNKEVEKIVTDLESVMSKHKQNIEDIQAEVKQLQEEVHKESYGSNESKRTGPVFDSIKELRNKLRLKQDENKKGNKDDVLKELCKLSDEVQIDKYDAKNYIGKGVGHDSIKIIRQNLIQMQEANKNWASSKEKLDKQIEDMKDMVSKFVFENCGEEKEKEAKTLFKNVKVQMPSTLIQLMLREIKNVIDRLNTLSKVAGAKMVEGNLNIADLSDTNRPTKLSEKYSELYDNEWTDAFDIVSKLKKDEESAIKILLDILLEAYRFCENVSDTQTFVLRNALLCPTQKVDESHGKKGKEEYKLESIQAKMVADLRKQTAGESTKDLKKHFKKEKVTVAGVRDCHVYADKCIELCWLMCLQSPPVFIGTKFDQKGKFDTNVYKPYSKSGKKYEFQVWPPLYLHEGGPLLSKGVAQGKK